MGSDAKFVLMDEDRISRSLKRMAHEIAEQNIADRPIVLFGINERGYVIAQTLANILNSIFENDIKAIQLPIKGGNATQVFEQVDDENAGSPFLIVVDDVIFSGQTMFTALKKITDHLHPAEIHTAVLVDRGHRKFPVKAEYTGMELPTKLNEHVAVVVGKEQAQEVIMQKK